MFLAQRLGETNSCLFYSLNGKLTTELATEISDNIEHYSLKDFDEDKLIKSGCYNLILSYLSLQYANDLIGSLIQYKRLLSEKGIFLAVIFSGKTLIELKTSFAAVDSELFNKVTSRVIPMINNESFPSLMQRSGHINPVVSFESITVLYNNIKELLYDLKFCGQFNFLKNRASKYPGKLYFNYVEKYYMENFSMDGKLKATYEIAVLSSNLAG